MNPRHPGFVGKGRALLHIVPFVFLLAGLVHLNSYGITWDEHYSHLRGERTFAYLCTCVSTRSLGDFASETDLGYARFHPTFFATLNHLTARLCSHVPGLEPAATYHVLPLLTASLGLLVFGLLMASLFDEMTAALSQAFMALYTPLLAHAHFNDKDVPGMVAALAAVLCLVRLLRDGRYRTAVATGCCIGLGAAINLNSLLVLPVLAAALLATGSAALPGRRLVVAALIVAGAATATLYACWPALWTEPTFFSRSVEHFEGHFWSGHVLYFGRLYHGTELPWHYTPMSLLMSTPAVTLALAIAGCGVMAFRWKARPPGHAIVLMLFAIPLLSRMIPGVMRYSGMRHVFLAVPGLAGLAGLGFAALLRGLPPLRTSIPARAVAVALVAASLATEAARAHPYESSYYNEIVRAVLPRDIDHYFEMDPYKLTYKDGLAWINAHAWPGDRICLPIVQFVEPRFSGDYPLRPDLVAGCEKADYAMFTSRAPYRYPWVIDHAFLHHYKAHPVFTIRLFNSDMFYVYETRDR